MRPFIVVVWSALLWRAAEGFAPSSNVMGARQPSEPMRLRAVEVNGLDATITAPSSPGASNSTQDVPLAVADMQGAVVIPTTAPRTNTLATWQRRLVTQEDPFSVHKLASIGYTVTSFALLGAAAVQAIKGDFAFIPPSLEPVVDAFTVSNLVMCIASIRMAFLYRQGDIPSRNAFLGTAVSSLFSGFFMVWISPFAMGDVFYDIGISRLSFAILVGLNGFFILDTLLKQDELIEGRRDRKAEDFEGRVLMDKIGYIFPVAFGMPLIAVTGFLASVAHDRYWFLEQCRFIDETFAGVNGMQAHIFYQQLSTSLGAAMASLFVTLRDKKLISKNQELAGIALFATPAFVWSVYTTYYFTSSLFLER